MATELTGCHGNQAMDQSEQVPLQLMTNELSAESFGEFLQRINTATNTSFSFTLST